MDHTSFYRYILPVIIIFASFVLGYLFDKIIMYRLQAWSKKTQWKGDDVIISSLKGTSLAVFLAVGIYVAVSYQNLNPYAMNYVRKAFDTALMIIVTVVASRMAVGFVSQSTSKLDRIFPASSILRNIIRIVIYVVGALVILNNLNIPIAPILTALGVGGLAVALALQPTLSNLFSGVQIIASKQLSPGDYVSLESGQEGNVEDITWRYTTIKSPANNIIIIPNSKIADAIMTNYYRPDREIPVIVGVRVSKNTDLEFAEKIAIEAARKVVKSHPEGVDSFEPLVRYHTMGESSIDLNVIVRVREFTQQFVIKHELVKQIHKAFRDNKIEIPNPVRTVYVRNEA